MRILSILFTLFSMTAGVSALIYENVPLLILIAISALCIVIYELGRIIELFKGNGRL